ncbi:hypothetical protein BD626DRAFT_484962 [Schizophyllum amplum]|uniref:Uncharacterized protein n=1 Tax=Schizophyllum amplum TaxID=97359 RepID=A0A550CQU9_9AGAR|nr:hypothetical protein BD626DRAFT_484962 [Auriculariopsis ampla]
MYTGTRALSGRNVLQRVEDMSANPTIRSFGPYAIACAGCGVAISTRRGAVLYDDCRDTWESHKTTCGVLRDWNNPTSARTLTAAKRAEHERSRKASRDEALAHLMAEGYLERV